MPSLLNPKTGVAIGYSETKGTTAEPFFVPMVWQASTLSYVTLQADAAGNLLIGPTEDETSRIDSATPPFIYTGSAPPGTAESAAAWKITRTDTTGPVKVLFANGAATYVNIWANRAALSYS